MKTSIFNMTLTLPPLIEMVEVEKDMPLNTLKFSNLPDPGICTGCHGQPPL